MRKIFISSLFYCFLFILTSCQSSGLVISTQPSPPITQRSQPPGAGYIWIDGDWIVEGNNYIWHEGHWEKARENQVWEQGHWQQKSSGWYWKKGRWH